VVVDVLLQVSIVTFSMEILLSRSDTVRIVRVYSVGHHSVYGLTLSTFWLVEYYAADAV